MASIVEKTYIEATQAICGGAPRIAGSRIRVSHIVRLTEHGKSPDEIVSSYPHLTLSGVHAALAYYFDHRKEIDDEIRSENQHYDQMTRSIQDDHSK